MQRLDERTNAMLKKLEDDAEIIEDEVPAPPEIPKSKPGEIYQLGRHRLMCGSATDIEQVYKLLNGVDVDLVITDPHTI